jgi:hypothetical protein
MKLNLTKNRTAKILSLLLAIAIWFLIKQNLAESERMLAKPPPRDNPVIGK